MEIEIFTLCDYSVDNAGKLTIVGTFDNINTQTLPHNQPLSIAIRLRFSEKESGQHTLNIKVLDPNNQNLGDVNGDFNIPKPPVHVPFSAINLPLNMGLAITAKGLHKIELRIDGEFRSGLTFNAA